MLYSDHHVHTKFSPDSQADVVEYILKAKELGLEYIVFTDHMEFGVKSPKFQRYIDYDYYIRYMKELEEEYEIPIKIGVEIGYERNYKEEIEEFLNKYDFHIIIASIHYDVGGESFYSGNFYKNRSKYEAYLAYFELVLDMVENFNNYHVVGHLDYIPRYSPYEDKHYNYDDYREILDLILKAIIGNKRGLEVNTSGLRTDLKVSFPREEVLNRYRELGGKYLSVGSDAHFNKDFMAHVDEAAERLSQMGFILIG